jgi:DNA primase
VQKIGKPAFEELIHSAGHLSDYFFEHLSAALDIDSIDGRARLVNLAKPLLARLPDGMFRQLMTERLAELVHTSVASVSTRLELPRSPSDDRPLPAKITRQAPSAGGKSPVRDAISILLYQPSLAQKIGDFPFKEPVDVPGVALLEELLQLLQHQPLASTGAVLEHWRDRDEVRHLTRLAQWSPVRDDLDLLPDLQRQLQLIYQLHLEQRIEYLTNRDKIHRLDENERKQYWKLQTLLQEARQSNQPVKSD